jgi:hypothetical protein
MISDGGDHGECRALVLRQRWAILDVFSGMMGGRAYIADCRTSFQIWA